MKWKFWHKEGDAPKLSRPKELPVPVGIHLVTKLQQDPDWVWSLRAVLKGVPDQRHVFDFRIFSPLSTRLQGLSIDDFNSLESHPDLILFEGRFNKSDGYVQMHTTSLKPAA